MPADDDDDDDSDDDESGASFSFAYVKTWEGRCRLLFGVFCFFFVRVSQI